MYSDGVKLPKKSSQVKSSQVKSSQVTQAPVMGLARARARASWQLGGARSAPDATGAAEAGAHEDAEHLSSEHAFPRAGSGGMAGRRNAGAASGAKPAVTEDVMWATFHLDVNVLILDVRGVIRIPRIFNALKSTSFSM